MKKYTLILITLLVFILMAVAGCDSRNSTNGVYSVKILKPENLERTGENITIYADNNITVARIQAKVSDSKGNAPMGVPVSFKTTLGSIVNTALTDSSGIAIVTLRDHGFQGTAKVTAEVKGGSDVTYVDIIPTPSVGTIDVITVDNMIVNRTAEVVAYPKDVEESIVQDGTIVTFKTDVGNFQLADGTDLGQTTQISASNGVAKTFFNSGTKTGIASVSIQIDTLKVVKEINVKPGNPNKINLVPEQTNLVIGGDDVSLMRTYINTQVVDRYDNPVESGINIAFKAFRMDHDTEIAMGSITGMMTTDDEGSARNRFSVGTQAGVVTIQAVADSALAQTALTISASELSSIQYAFQDQVDLNIRGTGGVEQFELVVNLFDSYGNLLDLPTEVYFRFAAGQPIPDGCRIGTDVTDENSDLAVTAYNGQARATVSSGSGSGTVYIEVSDDRNRANQFAITATKSNIVINGGMPAYINIAIGDYNSGTNIGGGLWEVEVNASVTDQHGNPVSMGTAVWFSLAAAPPDFDEPDWAVINAAAFIGNQNTEEDSTAGVAYTRLVYDGSFANHKLMIVAECGSITETEEFQLPMNEPQLTMYPQHGHVDFGGPHSTATDTISTFIICEVADQEGNYIQDVEISLWSDRGVFMYYVDGNGEMPYKVTGSNDPRYVKTLATGIAMAKILFGIDECPPPQPGVPGEQNVQVNGQIEGTDITNNTNVLIIRYQ